MKLALLLVLLPATALAAAPDLRVRQAPPAPPRSLRLRQAQAAPPAPAQAATVASDSAEPGWRDAEEKLIFKVGVGYALDDSPTSGDPRRDGRFPADRESAPLRTRNSYLLGDAVLGSRGLPVASLSTYFASQFRLGLSGASDNATRNDVWDNQDDAALRVFTGYAEYEASGLRLRAGRQFHFGAALFASQFDGATVAWEKPDYEVTSFVGRRAALYRDETPGLVAGAGARVRLARLNGWPVALAADVLSYEGAQLYVETSARFAVRGGSVTLAARALDNDDGDGLGFGRFSARTRYPLSQRLLATGEAAVVLSHETPYDYLSPEPTDVTVGSSVALALPEPSDSLRLGGGLLVALAPGLEAYGFGRAHLADSAGFDSTWLELGGLVEAGVRPDVTASAGARLRFHVIDRAFVGDAFDDMTTSGPRGFQEASGELRYRPGEKTRSAGASLWLRRYDFTGPYVEIDGDVRAGARLDGEWWPGKSKRGRLRAVLEAAQPSKALAPELGTQYSLRLLGEASF